MKDNKIENKKNDTNTKNIDLIISLVCLALYIIGVKVNPTLTLIGLILSIIVIFACIKHLNSKIASKAKTIIALVICSILVIFTVISLFLGTVVVNNTFQKSKLSSYVNTYKVLKKEVQQKISLGENPTCDKNCSDVYLEDYFDDFKCKVTDKGSYYEIYFEVEENIKFTSESCTSLYDENCSGNKIIGRIDKNQ